MASSLQMFVFPLLLGLALDGASSSQTREVAVQPMTGSASAVWIENLGQWPVDAAFVGGVAGTLVRVRKDALELQVSKPESGQGVLVRLSFEGASPRASVRGEDPQPGLRSYFLGDDPAKWVRGARAYGRVRCEDLYPGIDLVVRMEGGRPKYDLELDPGADLSRVAVRCEGAEGVAIAGDGSLSIETALGPIVQPRGPTYATRAGGEVHDLASGYLRLDQGSFGFDVPGWDGASPLTIDPELVWSTYVGSTTDGAAPNDIAWGVAVEPNGDVTIVGQSSGPDFPQTPGTFQRSQAPGSDVFVTRLSGRDGSLVYSSVLGGPASASHSERALDVAVDDLGQATVVGFTHSTGFPTTPGAFRRSSPTGGAFVFRLSATGSDMVFSTYLAGSNTAEAHAVDVLPGGSTIVGGLTGSFDYPVTPGAFDVSYGGGGDAFLTRLDPTGSFLEWSTFLGDVGGDWILDLVAGPGDSITVSGVTSSPQFPTTPGTFQPNWFGSTSFGKGFVTRIDATGAQLVWSTFLGGGGPGVGADAYCYGVAVEPSGGVVVAGLTNQADFPTTPGAYQTQKNGIGMDAFVTRFDPTGSTLVYSTFLGTVFPDHARSVTVDALGRATVFGSTNSNAFPLTPDAFDSTWNGSTDMFLCRLSAEGDALLYSTYLGGSGPDDGLALASAGPGLVAIGGSAFGPGFPTTPGAFGETYFGGQSDAVAALFRFEEILPQPPDVASGPRLAPTIVLSAGIETDPDGLRHLEVDCRHAPAASLGWLSVEAVGEDSEPAGRTALRTIPLSSNGRGVAQARVPLDEYGRADALELRAAFHDPASPERSATSNALTVQLPR